MSRINTYILSNFHHQSAACIQPISYRPVSHLRPIGVSSSVSCLHVVFVSWSKGGYHTEFTADGIPVLEASFASQRFSIYRAYKFNFTGVPTKPPALKALVFGTDPSRSTTVCYVSWNGATEVVIWKFYGRHKRHSVEFVLGSAKKQGFETTFTANGYVQCLTVVAFDARGRSLGRSVWEQSLALQIWETIGGSNGWNFSITLTYYEALVLVVCYSLIIAPSILLLRHSRRSSQTHHGIRN